MKKLLALSLITVSLMFATNASAKTPRNPASSSPSNCVGAENSEQAYLSNVEAALVNGKYKAVPRSQIVKTKDEVHNPEYEVTLSNGKKIHVSCDDSGDDQCGCWVGGPNDNH